MKSFIKLCKKQIINNKNVHLVTAELLIPVIAFIGIFLKRIEEKRRDIIKKK